MTEETLQRAIELRRNINHTQSVIEDLDSPHLKVMLTPTNVPLQVYHPLEDEIPLTDEENQALEGLRQAYLEILRTAARRILDNATREFENL